MGNKGTFSLNKHKPFYSWYQYLEGYSEELVEAELSGLGNIKAVYDPFGGSGTTMLYASMQGIKSFYSETNPFMRWVCETKVNSAMYCYEHFDAFDKEFELINQEVNNNFDRYYVDHSKDEFAKFYDADVYNQILAIKSIIEKISSNLDFKNVFLLALISNSVNVSNTIRRGDLRYATLKELKKKNKDIKSIFIKKLCSMREDISKHGSELKEETYLLADDVRDIKEASLVDCVVTSPPYLNGTNYIRNTKLELNLLGFLTSEKDITSFHSKGIIAGINNVSKRNDGRKYNFDFLDEPLKELETKAYDTRIIKMITGYFDNMYDAIKAIEKVIKPNGYFALDIGDSQFSGVHICTHDFLRNICLMSGFKQIDEEILRKRVSHNGMILSQRIMRFKVDKND